MSTTPRPPPSTGLGARTPSRPTFSTEPPSTTRRAPVHTPLDRSVTRDLLRSVRRGTPASASGRRKSNAPTPHAKAARRALDQRRAAMFTPGKNRRRSQMEQRETPMGILRNLGRALAPKSRPVATSSSSSASSPRQQPSTTTRRRSSMRPAPRDDDGGGNDEDDFVDDRDDASSEDPPLKRPRLSLPIDEDDDDDDDDLQPPRLSGVEEMDFTLQSIELPRRVMDERMARLSRGSLGSAGVSDYDVDDVTGTEGRPSDFFPGLLEDIQARVDANDETLQRIDDDTTRQTAFGGRQSDFNLDIPAGVDDQTTFLISEPAIDAAPTSPLGDEDDRGSVTQAAADNAAGLEPQPFDAYSSDGNEPLAPMFDDLPPYDDGNADSDAERFEDAVENFAAAEEEAQEDEEEEEEEEEEVTTATAHHLSQPPPPAAADRARAALALQDARTLLRLRRLRKRVSQHGIEYPPIPSAFVKKVAQTALQSSGLGGNNGSNRISADTLVALTQASEWYFEQLGDDLGAYAAHAKRKTIEDSDVATLMRRQRQVGSASTLFSLAQRHLPRELLQELRMPPPQPTKQGRAKRVRSDGDEEEVEVT